MLHILEQVISKDANMQYVTPAESRDAVGDFHIILVSGAKYGVGGSVIYSCREHIDHPTTSLFKHRLNPLLSIWFYVSLT